MSAASFGLMGVFGKLAYAEGNSLNATLLIRFGLAGALLLLFESARGAVQRLTARTVLAALSLGAFGLALQAGLYFAALTRIDASQTVLIVYLYPGLVMIGAAILGRERISGRRTIAFAVALAGLAIVLSSGAAVGVDPVGTLLALGASFVYAGFGL